MAGNVQFAPVYRQFSVIALFQVIPGADPVQLRRALQIPLAAHLLHVVPGGAAAPVAIAEGKVEIAAAVPLQPVDPSGMHRFRVDLGFVEHVQEAGDRGAVQPAPQEGMMREGLGVVIGPEDLLRRQAGHPEAFDDLGQRGAVAKGVRQPGHAAFHAQNLPEIPLPVQELAHQRFAAGHVGIRFHPHAAVGDPAAFPDGGLHFLEQLGVVPAAQFIFGALALQENGLRVFLQQAELGREGAGGFPARFIHGPQPGQIQMGIGNHAHGSGKGSVMRVDERSNQRARLHAGLPARGQGKLQIQKIQEPCESVLQRLAKPVVWVQIGMHIPKHGQIEPQLIGFLVPPAKGAFPHHGGAAAGKGDALLRENRAAGMVGQRRAPVNLHGDGDAFPAFRFLGDRQILRILVGMIQPVRAARAEGF